MEKQVERLKENQTELTAGSPWTLTLRGDALQTDRLLEITDLGVPGAGSARPVYPRQRAAEERRSRGDCGS